MSLRINQREANSVTILDLNGRVTLGEGCQDLSQLLGALIAGKHLKILLNLAEVNFIDSAGIGVLTKAFVAARREGGALKLLHLAGKIRDLLQITNLYQVFEAFTDEQAALASFR